MRDLADEREAQADQVITGAAARKAWATIRARRTVADEAKG